jgi:hypothetical protein
MEHLLGAHLEDHIGMGAHPDAARRDLAQQRVEIGAVAPLVNRIDPDEHAINHGELCAHSVADIVLIDDRFRIDADFGQRCEDVFEPAGLWRGAATRRFIAPLVPMNWRRESHCILTFSCRISQHFAQVRATCVDPSYARTTAPL